MSLQIIHKKIFEVREQKVMLDFDLAELYQTETKYLKRAVRQNMKKFPVDFMFELTKSEFETLRCNFSTSKRGGTRYMPFAFTEHGVTMLSSILKSPKARKMNIAVVRAFIALRKIVLQKDKLADLFKQLKELIDEHDIQLGNIYDSIENLIEEKSNNKNWEERERIGFKK